MTFTGTRSKTTPASTKGSFAPKQHSTDGINLPVPPSESRCSCARNKDGSTTQFLCPAHADTDPCLTMSQVTGKRRKGTIAGGRCTNCGWLRIAQ